MRLDKFLKTARIIKRRTVANDACDFGKVLVNGVVKKASYDVKNGDIIEITLGARVIKLKVVDVMNAVKKEDASKLYEIIQE